MLIARIREALAGQSRPRAYLTTMRQSVTVEGMRKVKSMARVSVAAPVDVLTVACDGGVWARLEPLRRELLDVSNARELVRVEGGDDSFVETDDARLKVSASLVEEPEEG